MSNERIIKVAAAQLAGIPREITGGISSIKINNSLLSGNSSEEEKALKRLSELDVQKVKEYSVERMLHLLRKAAQKKADLVVFPELALSSFFPYFYMQSQPQLLRFFETGDIREGVAKPLFDEATNLNIAFSFGFAEYLPDQRKRYNTYILFDKAGHIFKYRKTHIPGFEAPVRGSETFQFEKGQFNSSPDGYPVFEAALGKNKSDSLIRIGLLICHDRRYNAPYLAMGLKKVELILNGYNTPFHLTFEKSLDKDVYRFHYIPQQAQAISEGSFIVSSAIAGEVFGKEQIAGTCIISPEGEILKKTERLKEELVTSKINLRLCQTVKSQKYWGTRAEPQVLLRELIRLLGPAQTLQQLAEIEDKKELVKAAAKNNKSKSKILHSWQSS